MSYFRKIHIITQRKIIGKVVPFNEAYIWNISLSWFSYIYHCHLYVCLTGNFKKFHYVSPTTCVNVYHKVLLCHVAYVFLNIISSKKNLFWSNLNFCRFISFYLKIGFCFTTLLQFKSKSIWMKITKYFLYFRYPFFLKM